MKTRAKIAIGAVSVLLLSGVFYVGFFVGSRHHTYEEQVTTVVNKDNQAVLGQADFAPFWKVWNIMDQKFPGADKISAQDRVYGAIKGLVASTGDPYSVFFPPQDSKNFSDTISGSFEGIGMEVGIKDKVLTVIAPLKGTPAEKAGILPGDKILKINGKTTEDMSVDQAVTIIRGPKGTSVTLSMYREGKTKPNDVVVTRDVIDVPTIDTKLRSDGVYVISLYSFSATSATLMEKALEDFSKSGSKDLVIDLRGNPGGYLDAAVDMASFFLPEGDTIVTEDFGKNGSPKIYRSKGFDLLDMKNIKVAVLVDKGSASASEILSGALQQHNVAPLIGETTYGKGSVQEVLDVTKDTTMKITVAKWLTPNGSWISEHGLKPDIPVTVSDKDIADHVDPVLNRALEYFKTGK
ncbi:MAG: S41 family peptidase [bacterium]